MSLLVWHAVNHLGGKIDPECSDSEFEQWKECLATIAACPNAVVKCGGAQQRVGAGWEPPFHMHRRCVLCRSLDTAMRHALLLHIVKAAQQPLTRNK
jgi:hypothetical protein